MRLTWALVSKIVSVKILLLGMPIRAAADEEGLGGCAGRRAVVGQRGELRAANPENAGPRALDPQLLMARLRHPSALRPRVPCCGAK